MKKIAITASLLLTTTFFTALANVPAGSCPGTAPYNGICVPMYGADGKVSSYICADPEGSSGTKDCTRSTGGE